MILNEFRINKILSHRQQLTENFRRRLVRYMHSRHSVNSSHLGPRMVDRNVDQVSRNDSDNANLGGK